MIAINMIQTWGGNPVALQPTLEVDLHQVPTLSGGARNVWIRAWMRPFTLVPYHFSKYGPHCFGWAWFGFMVWLP